MKDIFMFVILILASFMLSVIFKTYIVPKLSFLDNDLLEWLWKITRKKK